MTELNYAAMAMELDTLLDEEAYEAFLRGQSLAKDHSLLLAAIARSDLRPSIRNVIEELIRFRKIRRAKKGRPRRATTVTHMIGLRRALCVMDLESAGWPKRDSAIEKAKRRLGLKYSTIEKAVLKYGPVIEKLKVSNPEFLDDLRSRI
jgi:hypothetical protein